MMLKIALVNHHVGGASGGGGGVRLMLELGQGLARRGHRVSVVVHDYVSGGEFEYATAGLEILAVREGTVEWSKRRIAIARNYWLDMPKVARLVPKDVDIVNSHDWLGLPAWAHRRKPSKCSARLDPQQRNALGVWHRT